MNWDSPSRGDEIAAWVIFLVVTTWAFAWILHIP